jgi:N-methylhydantoinase B
MMATLKPGDRVVIETAGGGGNGPPAARRRDALDVDLADGKVSVAEAQGRYGRA